MGVQIAECRVQIGAANCTLHSALLRSHNSAICNLYHYAGGAPLAARDPSGYTKSEDAQYEYLHTLNAGVPFNNCWNHFHCNLDGFHGGNGYRSVSAIPEGFFIDAVVRGGNSALRALIAMEFYAATHPPGRPMTPEQRKAAGNACEQVNCDKVRIRVGEQFRRGFSFGYGIWIRGSVTLDPTRLQLLVHELWHVYQFQNKGWFWYVVEGLLSATGQLGGWGVYRLPNTAWSTNIWDYQFEQQAEIAGNCVAYGTWCDVSPWK